MADESDPFMPPDEFVVPASSVPSYIPTNQGPKTYVFQSANAGQEFEIQCEGPSYLRLNSIFDSTGIMFAPAAAPANNTSEVILSAWPKGWSPGPTLLRKNQYSLRGSATLLYLPHAGTWIVTLFVLNIPFSTFLGWEVSLVPTHPGYAGPLVSNPAPTRHAKFQGTLAAGAVSHIGTLLALATRDIPNWFSIVFLRVKANATPSAALFVDINGDGTVGRGTLINGLAQNFYSWQELSGSSPWFSNNDAAVSAPFTVEAHFL